MSANRDRSASQVLSRAFGVGELRPGHPYVCPGWHSTYPTLWIFPDDTSAVCIQPGCPILDGGKARRCRELERMGFMQDMTHPVPKARFRPKGTRTRVKGRSRKRRSRVNAR